MLEKGIQLLDDNELKDVVGGGAGKTALRVSVRVATTGVGAIAGAAVAFIIGYAAVDLRAKVIRRSEGLQNWHKYAGGAAAVSFGLTVGSQVGKELGSWMIKKWNLEEE